MNQTLIIMAAGMASRYGSLKQVEGFGPSGETLMEYSLYNAIHAGFDKVIFVIRESMKEEFKHKFLPLLSRKIEIDFAFQELDILPEGFHVPELRSKPWGTGHAVWVAKEKVNGNFAVVNADDYYGPESFKLLSEQLKLLDGKKVGACIIGYQLKNTLSEFGSVSRAICQLDSAGYLQKLTERTQIKKDSDGIVYFMENDQKIRLSGNELVSMNLLGFTNAFFEILEEALISFLRSRSDATSELYLPDAITSMIEKYNVKVPVKETKEKTFGVTYPGDKSSVRKLISFLVSEGVYPLNLWQGLS